MDFSHLDDDTPPNAERTMIADIVATAARRQRTRRGAFVSVTTVCALAVGIGVVSAVGKPARNPRVAVIRDGGQSTTTSAAQTSRVPTTRQPETTSTIAPDPNVWVTVEIQLDQHQVQQGQDVTGTIVFNNTTSKRVTFANDNGCVGKWAVIVRTWRHAPDLVPHNFGVRPYASIAREIHRLSARRHARAISSDHAVFNVLGRFLPTGASSRARQSLVRRATGTHRPAACGTNHHHPRRAAPAINNHNAVGRRQPSERCYGQDSPRRFQPSLLAL